MSRGIQHLYGLGIAQDVTTQTSEIMSQTSILTFNSSHIGFAENLGTLWDELRTNRVTIGDPEAECVNKNETETKNKLVWNRLAVRSCYRWIDPNGIGHHGWSGRMMDKALRMGEISRV